ncbi:uncharacterized protein LOC128795877 isoform X1 [Vidua chalybeata]|uniref:uncharacterized protein LOC128795877 isoform X1 n=1 Tax=Vidua chalybeata TaxID=81927 RepID=UPI0023A8DE22|nr:uncharacterized protein LOC128795877 isoform X1 [Vidua chalybeata]
MGMGFRQIVFMCFILLPVAMSNRAHFPMRQPKGNVWETLAKAAGLDSICLTHSRPGKPFSTCLVGVPVKEWPIPKNIPPKVLKSFSDPMEGWHVWTQFLPVAHFEPQELDIFGSTRMKFCIIFNPSGVTETDNHTIDVTPNQPFYRNASSWCNYTKMMSKLSLQNPTVLPKGIFLICGDRIWPAIPAKIRGGPCSIGELSLITPNLKILREQSHRKIRSIEQYGPNCNDEVYTWDKARRIAVAIFSPQAASGVALTQLDHIACWLSKHTHAISSALSDMLTDIDSARQATLQNRAAIDYLLLSHGHGCEEFEGMCCMNLSDHSKSIHENIKQMQNSINKLQKVTGSWWDDFINLFSLSPLWREFLKTAFYILIGFLVLLLVLPCIFLCTRRVMDKVARQVFLVQTGGGDVGTQGVPQTLLDVLGPGQKPLRPWQAARDPCGLELDPWNNLPTLQEEQEITKV